MGEEKTIDVSGEEYEKQTPEWRNGFMVGVVSMVEAFRDSLVEIEEEIMTEITRIEEGEKEENL